MYLVPFLLMDISVNTDFLHVLSKEKGKQGIHRFNLFSQWEELLNQLQLEKRKKNKK